MKLLKTITVSLFISSLIFTSCKKYEEGPGLSIKSKKSRISNSWYISNITETSGDSESFSNKDLMTQFYMFSTDGSGTWRYPSSVLNNGEIVYNKKSSNIKWEFNNDKTILNIAITDYDELEFEKFEIIKLKKNEIKLKELATGNILELLPE